MPPPYIHSQSNCSTPSTPYTPPQPPQLTLPTYLSVPDPYQCLFHPVGLFRLILHLCLQFLRPINQKMMKRIPLLSNHPVPLTVLTPSTAIGSVKSSFFTEANI